MTEFSRVTLVVEHRRIDAVFPSAEPIGRLLPDMLHLAGDVVESPPRLRQLMTAEGEVLPWEKSLADASVRDGAVLTLARAEDAPPAPVVHDVAEEAADDIDMRPWRWGEAAKRWTATAATVGLMLNAGLLGRVMIEPVAAAGLLTAVAVAVLAIGGLTTQYADEGIGMALALSGGALGMLAVWTAADAYGWQTGARGGGLVAVLAVLLAFLGLTSPLGTGAVTGSGFVLLLGAAWAAGGAAQLPIDQLSAVMSVVAVLSLGFLPRLALTAAGLTALDDRRTTGASVSRHDVDVALTATHRGLLLATVVVAASAWFSGALLAGALDRWTGPLAALTAMVLASRSRIFPLIGQVVALQGAAAAIFVSLLVAWVAVTPGPPLLPFAVAVAAAGVPLAVLAVDPPDHVRVQLRRVADRVEAGAVIAMIPVAIGVFGTYGRLLNVIS